MKFLPKWQLRVQLMTKFHWHDNPSPVYGHSFSSSWTNEQELPWRKQIRPRPSGFELNQYGQDCTPVMKNSSSERKTKNTKDCQKLKFYQIHTNSNINQCFPKQFWCWSWRNGLDYSNIPFFVVYGKSPQGITQSCTILSQPPTAMLSQWLGRRECRLRLCNSLCRTELILLA